MEKTWIRERSFNIENGNEDVGGGGGDGILCVCSESLKKR